MKKYIFLFLSIFIIAYCKEEVKSKKQEPVMLYNEDFDAQQRIKQNLNDLYILKQSDRNRLLDCTKEKDGYSRPQRIPLIERHRNLNLFNFERKDTITGLLRTDKNFAMLVHMRNLNKFKAHNTRVFMGIRGLGWGIHKSSLTSVMIDDIAKEYPNDVVLLIDDYAVLNREKSIEHSTVTSICHNNIYNNVMVGNKWPVLKNGMGWVLYNKYFQDASSLHIVGYSNGSSPRHQLIETTTTFPQRLMYNNSPTLDDVRRYSEMSSYKYGIHNVAKIKSMFDIETNYASGKPMWDLLKVLYDFYHFKTFRDGRLYYATFILDNNLISSSVVRNHLMIIKAFDMKGDQLTNGFIRYRNKTGSIIIDILVDKDLTYRRGSIDLMRETHINKLQGVEQVLDLNHANIGKYTVNTYLNYLRAMWVK